MRTAVLVIVISIVSYALAGSGKPGREAELRQKYQPPVLVSVAPAALSMAPSPVDFDQDVKPIFQSKCMPCHFSGGQMYEQLPFDQATTIRKLGDKLFTRIKDEKQRRVIRDFLAQQP